jgi:hypothetical protein
MFRGFLARSFPTILLTLPILVSPPVASAQTSTDRAKISFVMVVTDRHAATSAMSSGDLELGIGQPNTTFLFSSLDGDGHGSTNDASAAGAYPLSWRFEARLVAGRVDARSVAGGSTAAQLEQARAALQALRLRYNEHHPDVVRMQKVVQDLDVKLQAESAAADSVTFELVWERVESRNGVSRKVAGDHQTITLRPGERHVLDLVRCPPDSPRANIMVEVHASPTEEGFDSRVRLRCDLWLVHQTSDGGRAVRRVSLTGWQGQPLPFKFDPIPLPIEAGAVDSPLRLEVLGRIAARLAADGTVRVALQTSRNLRFPGGGGASTGEKTLTLKPGDNVAIDLPNENGVSSWKIPGDLPRSPRSGVTVNNGIVRVDEEKFEAGMTTSITLTVNRER